MFSSINFTILFIYINVKTSYSITIKNYLCNTIQLELKEEFRRKHPFSPHIKCLPGSYGVITNNRTVQRSGSVEERTRKWLQQSLVRKEQMKQSILADEKEKCPFTPIMSTTKTRKATDNDNSSIMVARRLY